MKGKINMVKEGTDWKFDDVFWTLNAGAEADSMVVSGASRRAPE